MKYLSVLMFTMLIVSCAKNEPDAQTKLSRAGCDSGIVVKTAKNKVGLVSYIQAENQYLVNFHEPGTYDSVDVGYTCNLPEKFRQEGLRVVFSGVYRKHPVPSILGGYTNYYLELTKIALE
jgi:cytochrome c-type biogenesis protein CcmE